MNAHGPAQLELIRRYARTLREMHADAMRTRPVAGERTGRITRMRATSDPIRRAAKSVANRSATTS
jgi:hypothetical protein